MNLTFPFCDDTDRNLDDLKAPNFSLMQRSGQWDHRAAPGIRSKLLPHAPLCCFSFSVMRWNILSVRLMKNNQCPLYPSTPSSPSIRRSNVALMPWHGEKSDLAPGRGMFLVRLWCVGPGRGHMKGSPCQSAEMFSLSLMRTRALGQTWEHACRTSYKNKSNNTTDRQGILFLLFTGRRSEEEDKRVSAVIKYHYQAGAVNPLPPPVTHTDNTLVFSAFGQSSWSAASTGMNGLTQSTQ